MTGVQSRAKLKSLVQGHQICKHMSHDVVFTVIPELETYPEKKIEYKHQIFHSWF